MKSLAILLLLCAAATAAHHDSRSYSSFLDSICQDYCDSEDLLPKSNPNDGRPPPPVPQGQPIPMQPRPGFPPNQRPVDYNNNYLPGGAFRPIIRRPGPPGNPPNYPNNQPPQGGWNPRYG
ncbi:unnamed protein product [Caenorhabditis auriculariae]|uniref:Uncharacterized protein n=1 Tax=Caenorhabditis auriculariae TaxID=2777116 RepID=A0A8S1H9E6_9PELO|nr:unnamed protein product [Caenorhabditis auriculariae]